MIMMKMTTLGILLEKKSAERRWKYGINVFERYIGEILSHFRLPYTWIEDVDAIDQTRPDIIIAALYDEDMYTNTLLLQFVDQGGILISYAGLNALASTLGFREAKSLINGYVQWSGNDGDEQYLRFKHARPWTQNEPVAAPEIARYGAIRKESQQGEIAGHAVWRINYGQGWIERWSIDIPRTIVELQQGSWPVVEDGVPAGDGSGEINDGILKADDRCEMDWDYDRRQTETGAPYYAVPYADLWKEAIISQLLRCSVELGQTLPFAGYWPDGIEQVATISHDSDVNKDEHAESTLDILAECQIQTTWCMIEPGYSKRIYDKVKQQGHELALHYNALEADDGIWGEEAFSRQCQWFKMATGLDEIVTNKNHYTRFEGWDELFEWCEQNGIQADQTRGPSKRGNIGFLFGTCHAYFPISSLMHKNRLFDLLEVGFLTQDINHPKLTDASVIEPFLDQVRRVGGIAQFLFHQIHIHNYESVRNALRQVVREARARNFIFWTCRQINEWVRARRGVEILGVDEQGIPVIKANESIASLVLYIPISNNAADSASSGSVEVVYGVSCKRMVLA
jgi:hypothetical protein